MMKTKTMSGVVIGDFNSPDFPYALPSDLPEDFSYPQGERLIVNEPEDEICDCFHCIQHVPCSFAREVLRSRGVDPDAAW